MNLLVINGPNINMLGIRQPDIYGKTDYKTLVSLIENKCRLSGVSVSCFQSNHEGEIVDKIQSAYKKYDGIIINPAAFTHTSIAIADALAAVGIPYVEVHISDVSKREDFRQLSFVREKAQKTVIGRGINGYLDAVDYFVKGTQK